MATKETAPPLTPKEAAAMLNVHPRSIPRIRGLEWIEYPAAGVKPIRRITRESVRRLLEAKKS
jgi:hypothetical protein